MTVQAGELVLVHSPLVGPETWAPVAVELRERGHVATAIGHGGPSVLIGHSGIGPVLPHIASLCGNVVAAVYADASLPQPGRCWLESFPSPPELIEGAWVPNMWQDEATWDLVGIAAHDRRRRLAGSARRLPIEVYREPYPVPEAWQSLPSGYLAFVPNAFYAPIVARATALGWPVREMPGAHFEMLVDPVGVTSSLLSLLERMGVELSSVPE
jgi:hypothetical protein